MELEQNRIDDIFRRRLYDTETPPPAFVWDNVESELRKRRRRRFILWLFTFGMAGVGIWGIFVLRGPAVQAGAGAPGVVENRPAAAVAGSTEREANPAQAPGLPANRPVAVPASRAALPEASSSKAVPAPKSVRVKPLEYTVTALSAQEPQVTGKEMPGAASEAQNGRQREAANLPTPTEPLTFNREANLPQVKAPSFIRKKKDPKHCYDFNQNPRVWMLDAYAGPLFSRRTLESVSPGFDAYRQMRSATETRDWAFNAGLRGSLLLGRHFLVRTGLHYEQMTEQFEYADPNYIKYLIEVTQKVIDGKLVTVIDTVGVEYGENYVKTYNRYGLLDVPLEIGGELRRGRFGVSLNAGLSLNVLFWKRGTVLSPGGEPTPFTPGKRGAAEVFRASAGWSAGIGGQIFCHLQPRLRVFVEPYFRQILRPVTLDDQPVRQRYHNWGIKIGATKILN